MVAVGYPLPIVVDQGGEYDSSIDANLCAPLQMFAVPYSFAESAESAVWLGQSVVYFPVDLGVWCDGIPNISELVNCFQLSSTNGDVEGVVLFQGCWLVEGLSLFQADLESEELGSLCKAGS